MRGELFTAPYMPLFVRDWLGGTEGMSLAAQGGYLRLCLMQWQRGPLKLTVVRNILGEHFQAIWEPELGEHFEEKDGLYSNAKVEQVRRAAKHRHLSRVDEDGAGSGAGSGAGLAPNVATPRSHIPDPKPPEPKPRVQKRSGAGAPPAALTGAGPGKKPRSPKLTPEQAAAKKGMGDAWKEIYRSTTGHDYVDSVADWTALAGLVKRTQDVDEFRQRAFNLLESPVPFHQQHQTLRYLISEYPSFTRAHKSPIQCREEASDMRLRRLLGFQPASGARANGHSEGGQSLLGDFERHLRGSVRDERADRKCLGDGSPGD